MDASARWSKSPVAEAIEMLVVASPKKVSSRYSPIDPQRAAPRNVAGWAWPSQCSLAGQ